MCKQCATVKIERSSGGKQVQKLAQTFTPPAKVVISWKCIGCGLLNRWSEPKQAILFERIK